MVLDFCENWVALKQAVWLENSIFFFFFFPAILSIAGTLTNDTIPGQGGPGNNSSQNRLAVGCSLSYPGPVLRQKILGYIQAMHDIIDDHFTFVQLINSIFMLSLLGLVVSPLNRFLRGMRISHFTALHKFNEIFPLYLAL